MHETSNRKGIVSWSKPWVTLGSPLLVVGEITLIPDQTDKDARGRLLRYVFVGNTFVNCELIAQGYARAADKPPNSACAEYFQGAGH